MINFNECLLVRKWLEEEELLKREVSYLTREGKMIKVDFSSSEDLKNKYKQIDNENIKGWYITPNPTDRKGRKQENFTKREWLIVDIDTQREKNTNATDEELKKAMEVARNIEYETLILSYYCTSIWQIPYIALSGNGVHLLYRCDIPNTQEANELVSKWYSLLDKAFSTPEAKIDTSMASIAQLTKLYGTWARKAPEQENRPWRQSELREIHYDDSTWHLILGDRSARVKIIDIEKLEEMVKDLESIIEEKTKQNNFEWLFNWCEEHEIEYRGNKTGVLFKNCPFYPDHQQEYCSGVMCDKATSIDNFVFHCFGDHCKENGRQKHTWKELRALVENGEIAQEVAQEQTTNNNTELPSPINLTDERIVAEKEYWATNITSLDEALGGGLAKGEMSVVTGFPSGGKSTFVQQMVANYVRGNLSVGYYQGDRSQEEVKNNFLTIGLTNEELAKVNFYSRLQNISLEQMVEISSLYDVFVFDNFLVYERKMNADYTLSAQLVEKFSSVVKEKQNHIMTVAHQSKKNLGLAKMGEIASSQQIQNSADMILAVERYDENFATKVRTELGKDSEFYSDLLVYSRMNANPSAFFSVFKNQTGGDLTRIPILFEKEKKLFKNYQN